jgi:hypothetical protein
VPAAICTWRDRQARPGPGIETAVEHIGLAFDPRGKAGTSALGAHAGAAGEDHVGIGIDREVRLLDLRERLAPGAGDVGAGELVRLADIDEHRTAGGKAGLDFLRRQLVKHAGHGHFLIFGGQNSSARVWITRKAAGSAMR